MQFAGGYAKDATYIKMNGRQSFSLWIWGFPFIFQV